MKTRMSFLILVMVLFLAGTAGARSDAAGRHAHPASSSTPCRWQGIYRL